MQKLPVLIAEDDVDDQMFLREGFQRNRAECDLHFVNNGIELTDRLVHGSSVIPPELPAFIVVDLNMPLKDGYEAIREIKSDPALAKIPVVVVSASTRETEAAVCKELGCLKFHNKPLSFEGYDQLIEDILNITGANLRG